MYEERIDQGIKREIVEQTLIQLNERTQILSNIIKEAAEAIIPVAEERVKKKWITEVKPKLAKEHREVKQQRQKSQHEENEYRRLCNEVKKAARRDKRRMATRKM